MVSVEFEQVSQEGEKNIVKRRVEDYTIVVESSQRYVGVEDDGNYRVFTAGVVKSIHNDSATVIESSELLKNMDKNSVDDLPDIISVFGNEYGVIHGDINDLL